MRIPESALAEFIAAGVVEPTGRQDGTPADPATYTYAMAARDVLAFAALFGRFI